MFFKPTNAFHLSFKINNSSCISECSICYDEIEKNNEIKTDCNHIYCIPCFKKYLIVKRDNNDKLLCPYCRQAVDSISLNNEEEKQRITNELSITNTFHFIDEIRNSFYPSSIYAYHDIYNIVTIGDINLYEDIPDILIIYPFVVCILLLIYICFTLSIDYIIIINIAIIVRSWYLFYQIASLYQVINMENYCFISWVLLCTYCIYKIIY
jgi:hypothetical protein